MYYGTQLLYAKHFGILRLKLECVLNTLIGFSEIKPPYALPVKLAKNVFVEHEFIALA